MLEFFLMMQAPKSPVCRLGKNPITIANTAANLYSHLSSGYLTVFHRMTPMSNEKAEKMWPALE